MSRQQQDTLEQEQQEMDENKAALCKAMALAFPKIAGAIKGNVNPAFKSRYADLAAVVDAIKPALGEHGLWFSQVTQPSEEGVAIETILWHESGESMSMGRLSLPVSKRDAQGFGSALTYARRYSLMTAFGVPAEDDDGNAASGRQNQAQQPPPAIPSGLLDAAKNAALEGSEAFRGYWAKLSRESREHLRPHIGSLQQAAQSADKVAV